MRSRPLLCLLLLLLRRRLLLLRLNPGGIEKPTANRGGCRGRRTRMRKKLLLPAPLSSGATSTHAPSGAAHERSRRQALRARAAPARRISPRPSAVASTAAERRRPAARLRDWKERTSCGQRSGTTTAAAARIRGAAYNQGGVTGAGEHTGWMAIACRARAVWARRPLVLRERRQRERCGDSPLPSRPVPSPHRAAAAAAAARRLQLAQYGEMRGPSSPSAANCMASARPGTHPTAQLPSGASSSSDSVGIASGLAPPVNDEKKLPPADDGDDDEAPRCRLPERRTATPAARRRHTRPPARRSRRRPRRPPPPPLAPPHRAAVAAAAAGWIGAMWSSCDAAGNGA